MLVKPIIIAIYYVIIPSLSALGLSTQTPIVVDERLIAGREGGWFVPDSQAQGSKVSYEIEPQWFSAPDKISRSFGYRSEIVLC